MRAEQKSTVTDSCNLLWDSSSSGSWIKTKCAICYKEIYKWCETSIGISGDCIVMSGMQYLYSGEKAQTIEFNKELCVCEECRQRYENKLCTYLEVYYDKWLRRMERDNSRARSKNIDIYEEKQKKKINKEIKALEEKLKLLHRK